MTSDKKRYVYLDKYLEFQQIMNKKLFGVQNHIIILYVLAFGLIGGMSALLYKIFG